MHKCDIEAISGQIDRLRLYPFIDFAALALTEDEGRCYQWRYVSGNANQRYKRMVVKRGKGLPGMALLYGKLLVKDMQTAREGEFKVECPLMLAEGLQAAAALPIPSLPVPVGVLMVGSRQPSVYSAGNLQDLKAVAGELCGLLSSSGTALSKYDC
jgi:nitrogen regulatory protein A